MGNAIKLNGNTYSVHGKLGTGGFSEVYLVEGKLCPHAHLTSDGTDYDENNDSLYALKVMQCDDDDQLRRALMEIQLHRRLKHPNVLPLIESEIRMKVTQHHTAVQNALTRTKEVLLLFPVYPMGSLQQLLNKAEHMPVLDETSCLHIFLGVARGIREIHALGLAHRDIKPGNVLLSDTYVPVVMDLGSTAPLYVTIANHRDATVLVEEAAQFSSAAYRAPELWDDSFRGTISGKSDVWSLGCTLFALAFGPLSPFESQQDGVQRLAILNGSAKFPSHASGGGVSVAYVALIQRMLQVNVDDRPSLDDVIAATERLLESLARPDSDYIGVVGKGFSQDSSAESSMDQRKMQAQQLAYKGRAILNTALAL